MLSCYGLNSAHVETSKIWSKKAIFKHNFELREPGSLLSSFFLVFWDSIPKRCKGVLCVDLEESFPTSVYLQNLASIQPRTDRLKFGGMGYGPPPFIRGQPAQ